MGCFVVSIQKWKGGPWWWGAVAYLVAFALLILFAVVIPDYRRDLRRAQKDKDGAWTKPDRG
jgi:ABC-type transport system involved in Fe-S cluster assembly fused permease/ATPase subunit